MHLSPREIDKLTLHQAGVLAQKRLARGLRLNHPEAVALIATQLLELVRDGRRVAELMDLGRKMLGRRQVLQGVPELVSEVQVEGTFPDGTKLVTVHHPIAAEHGDLALALYGSFLPSRRCRPSRGAVRWAGGGDPGRGAARAGRRGVERGREAISLAVTNLADRPVQVGATTTSPR
jgi:urease subunit gamma/beta